MVGQCRRRKSATCSPPRASTASTRPGLPVAKVVRVERRVESGFARIVLGAGGSARRRAPCAGARADAPCSCRRGRPSAEAAEARSRRRDEGARVAKLADAARAAGRRHDHAARIRPAAAAGQPALHRLHAAAGLRAQHVAAGPRTPAMPDLLALALVFWNVHQPRRVGVGLAFVVRAADGRARRRAAGPARAGLHAAELRRDHACTAGCCGSACSAGGAGAAAVRRGAAVSLVVRMLSGGMFPGWAMLLAPVVEAALWPVVACAAAGAAAARARSRSESTAVTQPPLRREGTHDRTRDVEHELGRFRGRLLARGGLRAAGVRAAGRAAGATCRCTATRSCHAGRGQPHRGACRSSPTAA